MKLDLNRIRAKYAALTDESLRQELLLGPGGFSSPPVWDILLEEAKRRGMDESMIPTSDQDPLVALASFAPNIEITDGPFEPPAQLREDGKLILFRRGDRSASAKDHLEQLTLPDAVERFEIISRGIGSIGQSIATRLLGGGLVGGLLSGAIFSKTRIDLAVFTIRLRDGRVFQARTEADLARDLERLCARQ